jgi:hypothetical protein
MDAGCLQAVMSEQEVRSARGEVRKRAPELRRVLEFVLSRAAARVLFALYQVLGQIHPSPYGALSGKEKQSMSRFDFRV